MPKKERREYQRYSVHVQVDILAGNEMGSGLMVGTSLEGLRIKTPKLIRPSTDVMVTFSTGKKVVILAGVVWVLDKIKKGLSSYLAGLQIYSVTVGNREIKGMAERTAFLQDLQI